jgi:hypothetical protein
MNINLSDDVIRNWLNAAFEFLPDDQFDAHGNAVSPSTQRVRTHEAQLGLSQDSFQMEIPIVKQGILNPAAGPSVLEPPERRG